MGPSTQEHWPRAASQDIPEQQALRSTFTSSDIFKILFAILLPPLGVFLEVGLKGHFWLNILLTLLGYIPGIVHALYVILTR